jgi:pyruvate dehydrogenase E2 component (dihydrolipoamide acetyltransferase)
MSYEVKIPDIGDFTEVPIVSILVSPGDMVSEEDPLLELESDKATMEVPSPVAGKIIELKVAEGDTVSEGSLVLLVEAEGVAPAPKPDAAAGEESPQGLEEQAPAAPAAAQAKPAPVVTDAGFGKAHASPSVRAFARQLEIDIAQVNGTCECRMNSPQKCRSKNPQFAC